MGLVRLGPTPKIVILYDDEDTRRGYVEIPNAAGGIDKPLIFFDRESVTGQILITLQRRGSWYNYDYDHLGIRVELCGQIELANNRGPHYIFLNMRQELARPGELLPSQVFDFEFSNVPKPYESYIGENVKLRYFIRASIIQRINNLIQEKDFIAHTPAAFPLLDTPILWEIGVEDSIHIEFEYNQSAYDLQDSIVGTMHFSLVRIYARRILLHVDRVETTTTVAGTEVLEHREHIVDYEVIDGSPIRGDSIPIRLFLGAYNTLTPTFLDICNKFSVQYFLNVVVEDMQHQRFYKQKEIILYRRGTLPLMELESSDPEPGPSRNCQLTIPTRIQPPTPPPRRQSLQKQKLWSSTSLGPVAGPSWAMKDVFQAGGSIVDYAPISKIPRKKSLELCFEYSAASQTVAVRKIRNEEIKPPLYQVPIFLEAKMNIHNKTAKNFSDDDHNSNVVDEPGENGNLLGHELDEIQAIIQKTSSLL